MPISRSNSIEQDTHAHSSQELASYSSTSSTNAEQTHNIELTRLESVPTQNYSALVNSQPIVAPPLENPAYMQGSTVQYFPLMNTTLTGRVHHPLQAQPSINGQPHAELDVHIHENLQAFTASSLATSQDVDPPIFVSEHESLSTDAEEIENDTSSEEGVPDSNPYLTMNDYIGRQLQGNRHLRGYEIVTHDNENGLHHGPLDNSLILNQYINTYGDSNWLAFCNKYQTFIADTGNNPAMVERLEILVTQLNESPLLRTQVHRIAEDSNANCQDAAFGSLIEMEKANLRFQLTQIIHTTENQDIALSQLLELAHGFYNLENLEQLASEVAGEEEVEAFLYFLKKFSTLIHVPIEPADFRHDEYAQGLYMDVNGSRVGVCSDAAQLKIQKKLLDASKNTNDFAQNLAKFEPFHEYITKYDHAKKAEYETVKIQESSQALSLALNELETPREVISQVAVILKSLQAHDQEQLIFPPEEVDAIHAEIQQLELQYHGLQHQDLEQAFHPMEDVYPESELDQATDSGAQEIQDNQDQSDELSEHLSRLERGELHLAFGDGTSDRLDPTVPAPAEREFEVKFLTQKIDNLIMRLHNNAARISYFNAAKIHATLFLATVDIP